MTNMGQPHPASDTPKYLTKAKWTEKHALLAIHCRYMYSIAKDTISKLNNAH